MGWTVELISILWFVVVCCAGSASTCLWKNSFQICMCFILIHPCICLVGSGFWKSGCIHGIGASAQTEFANFPTTNLVTFMFLLMWINGTGISVSTSDKRGSPGTFPSYQWNLPKQDQQRDLQKCLEVMRQERHWYWSCWGCFYSNYVEEILNRLDECTATTSHFCKTLAWCLR